MNRVHGLLCLLAAALVMLAAAGCGGDKPVKEEVFVSFYIDLAVAQDSLGSAPEPTARILNDLYKRYGITRAEYNATLAYYNSEPKRWETFFQKVTALLEAKRDAKPRL